MVTTLVEQNNMNGLLSGWGLSARPCDICHTACALLYCRGDAAFLCGPCDSRIHMADHGGIMTVRHERVWMCEVCEQAPAAVTCKADAAALCTSCDHDIHSANPLARRHERVPVTPFVDSAVSAAVRSNNSAAASTFLVPDSLPIPAVSAPAPSPATIKLDDNNDAEAWLIPNPNSTFHYNESDLLDVNYGCPNIEKIPRQSIESQSLYSDSVVPTQSKGHLTFSNPSSHLFQSSFDIDFSQPSRLHNKKDKLNNNSNNNDNEHLFSAFNFSTQHSVSSSDIGVVPEGTANSMSEVSYAFSKSGASSSTGVSSAATGSQVPGLDREARVLRYREKRKNRKFEKTIRYASRKAYAETRPRIKGRFAKRTDNNNNETPYIESLFGTGSVSGSDRFLIDNGYGVVPTF